MSTRARWRVKSKVLSSTHRQFTVVCGLKRSLTAPAIRAHDGAVVARGERARRTRHRVMREDGARQDDGGRSAHRLGSW